MSNYQKGDRIRIKGDEIAAMMGYAEVTGTIFSVSSSGVPKAIQCDQTGCIEGFDFDADKWEKL